MKPRTNCIVCEKEIYRKGIHIGSRNKSKRGKASITCSSKCSAIYQRIFKYIRDKSFREIMKKHKKQVEKFEDYVISDEYENKRFKKANLLHQIDKIFREKK